MQIFLSQIWIPLVGLALICALIKAVRAGSQENSPPRAAPVNKGYIVDDVTQFFFNDPQFREVQSREIGRVRRPSARDLVSVMVGCKCGHVWHGHSGQGLDAVVGGYLVTCPSCRASDLVNRRAIDTQENIRRMLRPDRSDTGNVLE